MGKETHSERASRRRERRLLSDIKAHKGTFAVYTAVRLLVIAILVLSILNGAYENVFTCVLSLVLLMLPYVIERRLGIDLPSALEITVILFIFAAEILGELRSYYVNVPHWDTMLHTVSGFIYAAVGFAMLDILNKHERVSIHLSPLSLAFVAFCFSMTIGAVWEIFEFSIDQLFHKDMQKDTIVHYITSVTLDETRSNIPITIGGITEVTVNGQDLGLGGYLDIGLLDTMKDLIVNLIGAVVFSVIGYFYVKNRGRGRVAKMFVPVVLERDTEPAGGEADPEKAGGETDPEPAGRSGPGRD